MVKGAEVVRYDHTTQSESRVTFWSDPNGYAKACEYADQLQELRFGAPVSYFARLAVK